MARPRTRCSRADKKYTCPVCGYKTIEHDSDICEICFWEWDGTEHWHPIWWIWPCGPNKVGLYQAQKNYQVFGACELRVRKYVRTATKRDIRDPTWKPKRRYWKGEDERNAAVS